MSDEACGVRCRECGRVWRQVAVARNRRCFRCGSELVASSVFGDYVDGEVVCLGERGVRDGPGGP